MLEASQLSQSNHRQNRKKISAQYTLRYKLRDCVFQNYFPGVFSERHKSDECHEVVLNGLPWNQGSSQSIHARSIMALLLKEAHILGWTLLASADVPAKFVSKNIFHPQLVGNKYLSTSNCGQQIKTG